MARIIEPFEQFFDGDGDPLINGWLKFTESGTNLTDKDTFADINLTIPNTNPLQLDSEGRCPNVFGSGSYRITLFTNDDGSPGIQIDQKDPVGGESGTFTFGDWNSITTYSINAIVVYNDDYYRSRVNGNQNNTPSSSPTQWEQIDFVHIYNAGISYDENDWVVDPTDGQFYISLTDSNLNNTPSSSPAEWKDQTELNRVNIATNTADIATNTANIATNTSDIATNTTNIATNTADIATNTANIATNTTNISDKMDKSQNLNDVANKTTSRTNLDVYSKSEVDTKISDNTGWESWQSPSFNAGWEALTNLGRFGLQYRRSKDGLYVHLCGYFRRTGTGTDAFTLPIGYRPSLTIPIWANHNPSITDPEIYVESDGNLWASVLQNEYYGVNSIFPIA